MKVLLAAVADLAGTEATPDNAESLVEEFGGAARMLGAVLRNTANPTMLEAGYKVNVIPDRGHRARRRPVPARVRGRVLRHHSPSCCGDRVDIEFLSHQQPWETPYDGHAGRRDDRGR